MTSTANATCGTPFELASTAWIEKFATPVQGAATGPLAGLRFAVKNNIDVLGVQTTAGCPAYAYQAAAHATVVRRLLDAGASLEWVPTIILSG